MKEMWDARYSVEGYAYGTEPNEYLRQVLEGLEPGRLLLPGEGEGRNAVYAAGLGWKVSAFDLSGVGKEKAMRLAAERGVEIDYRQAGFGQEDYEAGSFDAAGLIYVHAHPLKQGEYHARINRYLKKGGLVILEGFSVNNLDHVGKGLNNGGPKDKAMLFTVERIRRDFPGYEILELREESVPHDEGAFHQGTASVIRFTGRKRGEG